MTTNDQNEMSARAEKVGMTREEDFQFRSLLSRALNARAIDETDTRQLAHEDHLRNYVDSLLAAKDAEIKRLESALRVSLASLDDLNAVTWEETVFEARRVMRGALETGEG